MGTKVLTGVVHEIVFIGLNEDDPWEGFPVSKVDPDGRPYVDASEPVVVAAIPRGMHPAEARRRVAEALGIPSSRTPKTSAPGCNRGRGFRYLETDPLPKSRSHD